MNPNDYYPQSSGAAQMTGYQSADPAASASISAGSTGWTAQQQIQEDPEFCNTAMISDPVIKLTSNQAPNVAELARRLNWRPEWVEALIELRLTRDRDRQSRSDKAMPFDQILDAMKQDFGEEIPLTTASLDFGWKQIREKLPRVWGRHKRSLSNTRRHMQARGSRGAAQPSHSGLQGSPANSYSGSVGAPQSAYGEPFRAPQPAYGASYRVSQSGYGGQHAAPQPGSHSAPYGGAEPGHHPQYGASQPGPSTPVGRSHVGPDGRYGAPQPGSGDPYLNTPGTHQQLPSVASYNPPAENFELPQIVPGGQLPRNQGPTPMEPPYQVPGRNYNYVDSQAMMPAMQQPLTWYWTGGSDSQAAHGEVSEQEDFGRENQFAPR